MNSLFATLSLKLFPNKKLFKSVSNYFLNNTIHSLLNFINKIYLFTKCSVPFSQFPIFSGKSFSSILEFLDVAF